jgi:IS4 transposase
MVLSAILNRFMEKSPFPVMARVLMERVLTDERLNICFDEAAERQYTKDLLFSSIFELMSLVVMKVFPSVNAAYQTEKANIGVTITSVYNKLNNLEEHIPAALVLDTGRELGQIVNEMDGACKPLLSGYRVKMLDGNCLASTEHRLAVLRKTSAGALPGKSLVIYDPSTEMILDVIPCKDGHAQERSLLDQVLDRVNADDVIVCDRNFCVRSFLFGLEDKGGYFACRHHKQMPYKALSKLKKVGTTETGTVYEQQIEVSDDEGRVSVWRAITVQLKKETRDGDKELVIITNLPLDAADAISIAEIYRKRWTIETMFQELESYLKSEINTLGYPQAALFGFCVALIAYNVLAVIKAALRNVHGEEKIKNEVSGYYIAGEISRTYEGMSIAIEEEEWSIFRTMAQDRFVAVLLQLANNVKISKYKKRPRGPKIKQPERSSLKNEPHVSTAKLLLAAKKSP